MPTQRVAANAKLVEPGEAADAGQTSVLQTAGDEATLFLRETCPPLECSPTDWRNVSGVRLPRMAELVCQYLCITALSVFG